MFKMLLATLIVFAASGISAAQTPGVRAGRRQAGRGRRTGAASGRLHLQPRGPA